MADNVTTLTHNGHVAMYATPAWLDQFEAGTPATVPCLRCPTAVRYADLVKEQTDANAEQA